mmetsp:Transcript_11996/g.30792  ORF Transcript_11996/g.30792 Transcript_11996/m.30792 type:complete len:378 (-) Transcript_11996:159-1292(-)|eukprot:jgi/Tetstr1/463790/TSEL_008605.t1
MSDRQELSADGDDDRLPETSGGDDGGSEGGAGGKGSKQQEKNRLAQRRFRERQKQRVNTLQEQIKELTESVQKLTVTKHDLDTRNSLLESVLTVKDEQLRVMRERGHVMSQKIKEVGGANSGTITVFGPEGQQLAVVLASERLTDDSRLLLALSDMHGLYVKRLSECLAKLDAGTDLDGSALQQLDNLVASLFQQVDAVLLEGSSSLLKWLVNAHDESAKKVSEAESATWLDNLYDRIVQQIELTPEQSIQIWNLYQAYLSNLKEMMADRIRVQNVTSTNAAELTGIYSIKRATDFLKSQEAVAMYKDSLIRQQNVLFELMRTVCRGLLTPVQAARMLITAFPLMCDVIHLAKAAQKRFPAMGNAEYSSMQGFSPVM